jgi:hypothetical protein
MSPILTALIAFLAALAGGVIQAVAARNSDRVKFERDAKWGLYTNFFVTLGELAHAKNDPPKLRTARWNLSQVRGRIGVIAAPEVVIAVAKLFEHRNLETEEAQQSLVLVLTAMRKDVGIKGRPLDAEALSGVLFDRFVRT